MSLGDYLQLLDWTGRQLAKGKKGRIPDAIEPLFGAGLPTPPAPFFQRLQLDQNGWCDLAAHFDPCECTRAIRKIGKNSVLSRT